MTKQKNSTVLCSLAVAFAIALVGCSPQPSQQPPPSEIMDAILRVELDPSLYPSRAEYQETVIKQVENIVKRLSSPTVLKDLYLACARLHSQAPEFPQERLQWIDSYSETCDAILFRLAELDSEEGTQMLIELYGDKTLRWDGEAALNIGHAISRCGIKALPYLGRVRPKGLGQKHQIQQIRRCIEEGKLYLP